MSSSTGIIPRKEFLRAAAGALGGVLLPVGYTPAQKSAKPSTASKAEKFAERVLADTAASMLSFGAYIGFGGDYLNVSAAWQYSWFGRPN